VSRGEWLDEASVGFREDEVVGRRNLSGIKRTYREPESEYVIGQYDLRTVYISYSRPQQNANRRQHGYTDINELNIFHIPS